MLGSEDHFDIIWLGTGQATMTVIPQLIAMGKRVAVVESGLFGGTCVNSGCTPTKTLVASAYAVHMASRGDDFGFSVDEVCVDFTKAMAVQQKNRSASSTAIENRLVELTEGNVYRGFGKFASQHEVTIGRKTIRGDSVVIHTGTKANVPDLPGINDVPWLTNESILDLKEIPRHLIIVGGSYIALEFGQLFRRLGSDVTVLERGPRLVVREDEDVSALIASRLTDEGVNIRFGCAVTELTAKDGITAYLKQAGQPHTLNGSHILFAIGRSPNCDQLNLEAADVATDERGYIPVNDFLQTNLPHIYAVGDINGRGAFTHTAVNDGEIFLDHYQRVFNAHSEDPQWDRRLSDRTTVYSMFIDPPLARVGMNETEARNSNRDVLMATMPMSQIARAREKRETHGIVKILVDADTEELLGATILGTSGDEVIGAFATLIQTKASYKLFRRIVFPHPTISELMPWVLDRLEPLPK